MSGFESTVVTPTVKRDVELDRQQKRQPRYHVILWDDDDHSYEYVILMMRQLFGLSFE